MDVHAPHEPIHSTRDFFLHLFTITVGLLIALGLEGLVEAAHHRHLLHTAEANLHDEFHQNRATLAGDEKQLQGSAAATAANLQVLTAIRNHQQPPGDMRFGWEWNGLEASAWNTARDTGAIALMPYESAQEYAVIYSQQELVNQEALIYVRGLYGTGVEAKGQKLSDLQPAELDKMIANAQQALIDADYLLDLCHSLDVIYGNAEKSL